MNSTHRLRLATFAEYLRDGCYQNELDLKEQVVRMYDLHYNDALDVVTSKTVSGVLGLLPDAFPEDWYYDERLTEVPNTNCTITIPRLFVNRGSIRAVRIDIPDFFGVHAYEFELITGAKDVTLDGYLKKMYDLRAVSNVSDVVYNIYAYIKNKNK